MMAGKKPFYMGGERKENAKPQLCNYLKCRFKDISERVFGIDLNLIRPRERQRVTAHYGAFMRFLM